MRKQQHNSGRAATRIKREFFRQRGMSESTLIEVLEKPFNFQKKLFSSLSYAMNSMIGTRFPKGWEDLRSPRANPYLTNPVAATRWAVVKLSLSSKVIARAIAAQKDIEQKVMIGHYDEAQILLDMYNCKFGVSLWSMDAYFVVREQIDGFSGNRWALSKFYHKVNSGWARVLAYNSSYRSLNSVSTRDYESNFRSIIDSCMESGSSSYAADYLLYRFLDVLPETDEAFCNVLHYEARHPLVDQYSTLLRLLASRARQKLQADDTQAAESLANEIEDPYNAVLSGLASRLACSGSMPENEALRHCTELYSLADYRGALQASLSLLKASATDFILYDIVASSSARLGVPCPNVFHDPSLAQMLVQYLYDWYAANRARRQSLEDLRRLARALHSMRLGPALHDFVNSIDEQLPPLGHECVGFLASPIPLPHSALTYADTRSGQEYIDNYRRRFGESASIRLIDEYLQLCWAPSHEAAFGHLAENFRLRYRSAALLRAGEFAPAVRMLSKLRNDDSSFVKLHPELYAGEASALLELGEIERAATLMADLYCDDHKSMPPALLRRFGGLLVEKSVVFDKSNVSWPILAAATLREEGRIIDTDRVHDFVGDYIESHGYIRPSELLSGLDEPPRSVLSFLMGCCTPEILESSIWYESQEEVLRERLSLCTTLHERYRIDDEDITLEIADLTRRLAIADITSRIERSRIYVDTQKIIDLVDEKTLDQIDRLLMLLTLKDKELRRGVKIVMLPSAEGGRVVVVDIDESLGVFESIFETIKKQFLYSPELGLDANLSQRIRHGTLAGEVRAIFDRLQLTTKKDSGEYLVNRYWLSQLELRESLTVEAVDEDFKSFSKKVDDLLQLAREKWVQIKTDANPNGLFDYTFSASELERILDTIYPHSDLIDVCEVVAESLSTRTEACLERVRGVISGELYTTLTSYLDELQAAVETRAILYQFMNSASLRGAITQCKTDLARELPKISNWFRMESHKEHKKFHLRDLVGSVEQVLNRVNSNCNVIFEPESVIVDALPGAYFRALWDLLVILFDNACKHSGLSRVEIRLRAYFTSEVSLLTCTNNMSDKFPITLKDKVDELNRLTLENENDLSKLRQEGGSGIAKLHKIVRHDMGRTDGYSITFDVTADGHFQVNIDFGGGVLHEGLARR
jgi:hypothetical protein